MQATRYLFMFLALMSGIASAEEADVTGERVAAVREAAVRIRHIQRDEGNGKAMALVNECHLHVLRTKSKYDSEVENCLVMDYYVTLSSAALFSQMSEQFRKANNLDVNRMKAEMRERIGATLGYFKLTRPEAEQVAKLLRENVMQSVQEEASRK